MEKGTIKEREKQHHCNMSGGAAKRAKRPELTKRQEALLNAMLGDDENAFMIAANGDEKDFHKIPNIMKMVDVSRSVVARALAQVGEKRSLESGISAPEAKLHKSSKSAEARVALRAVERASNCEVSTQIVLNLEERESAFKDFKRQLDEMDKDETVDTEEYDDVIKTMKLLETHYKKEAFGN